MAKKKTHTTIKKTRTIFEHLSGIQEKKDSWKSLSDVDRKSFSPFIVNRWLSMNMDLLPIVNMLQKYTIGLLDSREVYKLYLDILPKRKSFNKYIKGNAEGKYNSNLLEYLAMWYQVSQREVIDYMEFLSKDDITNIVKKYGLTDKEIKTLLK